MPEKMVVCPILRIECVLCPASNPLGFSPPFFTSQSMEDGQHGPNGLFATTAVEEATRSGQGLVLTLLHSMGVLSVKARVSRKQLVPHCVQVFLLIFQIVLSHLFLFFHPPSEMIKAFYNIMYQSH